MANHKSALKRVRQIKKRRMRNKSRKTRVKNVVKAVETAIVENNAAEAQELLKAAQKTIDRTACKGTIHRRTAARKISRLTRKVHALGNT